MFNSRIILVPLLTKLLKNIFYDTDNILGETNIASIYLKNALICNSYDCQYHLNNDRNILFLKKLFKQGNSMFRCRLRYSKVF